MARELAFSVTIKDCEVQTYKGSGAGGQNRNKRETGVRIIHHPSGARAESCEQREQGQNKKTAFKRMAQTREFQAWLRKQRGEVTLAEIAVSEAMRPRNLKMEELNADGEWVPTSLPTGWWKQ